MVEKVEDHNYDKEVNDLRDGKASLSIADFKHNGHQSTSARITFSKTFS